MRKLIVLIAVVFTAFSCEEDVRFNNPSIQGMKNNVFWRALESKAIIAPDRSLVIEAYVGNEVLYLKTNDTISKVYALGINDVDIAAYVLKKGVDKITYATGINVGNGQITIIKNDKVKNRISGTFKFNANNTDDNSVADPVLNFYQGFFYVPLVVKVP